MFFEWSMWRVAWGGWGGMEVASSQTVNDPWTQTHADGGSRDRAGH